MDSQIQQAVEMASGSTNDVSLKQQALGYIQQFKANPESWKTCQQLLNTVSNAPVKFFALQCLAERIPTLSDSERMELKQSMLQYLRTLLEKNDVEPTFLRMAAAKVFGLLFTNGDQTVLKGLLGFATQDGSTFNDIAADYYLKTLVIIHQEIGDQMIVRDKQQQQRTTLLKDYIRDNEMAGMATVWRQILKHYMTPQGSGGKLTQDIIEDALTGIGSYSSWIDINLILDQEYLQLFYQCLTNAPDEVKLRTTQTLTEILHKKMPPPKKLEVVSFLNLGSFLNGMNFDVKDLDFNFAQALAKLVEQLGSECVEVLDRSSYEDLKTHDDFRNAGAAKILEVMPLVFKFLENEYDDISLEVFPFLGNFLLFLKKNIVNEDIDLSVLNNDQLLTGLLKKIILKMRWDESDDGDDEDSIELFTEVRQKLSSFQDSMVIINDMLSLDVMIDSINSFLFTHLGDSSKAANWRDIELGLYQLTYYSEMLRNNVMNLPKTMINASRPYYVFNEMLCKVINNSMDILLSHPLIQLLFFELIMKHNAFFTNNGIQVEGVDKQDILLKVLKIFVSNFGIFSENPKVKYRSWYLFYKFIKMTRPQLDDGVIRELIHGLSPLLNTPVEITANHNAGNDLHNIDLTQLEEAGSFENQQYLLEAIGVLTTLIKDPEVRIQVVQSVMQPPFSVLEKSIGNIANINLQGILEAHHALTSIGTLIKGFEALPLSHFTDKFVAVLQQVAQVVMICLEQFDDFNIIREAAAYCMVRLFILLSKLGNTHGQVLQSVLSKYIEVTMNSFDKLTIQEVINFINFVSQTMHACDNVPQIYPLLSSLLPPFVAKLVERIDRESSNASDDFVKRDIVELQKALVSLLIAVSNGSLNSLWLSSPATKETLTNVVQLMLNYSYNYASNDTGLVKLALGELNCIVHGLGSGKVLDPRDKYKNDANGYEKSQELVANAVRIFLELTFKLQNKDELLKDAQFRNGVLLEASRLLRAVAYIGYDVPDQNTAKKGKASMPVGPYNDAMCQQIRDALVSELGMPVEQATQLVQGLIGTSDRQFTKHLAQLIQ